MPLPNQPGRPLKQVSGSSYPENGMDGAYPERAVEEERFDPRQYVAVVLSQWWLVLLLLVLGTAAGAAYCYLATPIYRASCRYEIFQERDGPKYLASRYEELQDLIGRHALFLRSRTLRKEVVDKLQIDWGHRLLPEQLYPALRISPVRESTGSMLDITVDAVSGEYALEYLEALLDGYERVRKNESAQVHENAIGNLRVELDLLSTQLKESQEKLVAFQREHNVRLTEAQEQMDDQFMANLIQRQNAVRMERTVLESQFPFLDSASTAIIRDVLALTMETHDATGGRSLLAAGSAGGKGRGAETSAIPAAGQSSTWPERMDWQSQEEMVASLEAEYQAGLKIYKTRHPKMVEMNRRVEEARRNLRLKAEVALKRLKARWEALKMQEKALAQAAGAWKKDLRLSTGERAEHEHLLSRVEHLKKLHDQVYSRIIDSSASRTDKTYTRTVEAPRIGGVISPNRLKAMIMSVVGALALGIGLAFGLDYLDTGPVDIVRIEEDLGLCYISGIPRWDQLLPNFHSGSVQIVMTREESSTATEAYRSLRVNIEHLIGDKKGYTMLVTSGDAGEGKSFTCVNLAIASAWTGKRVLLVDGDLRNASLHRPLKIKNKRGTTDLLAGRVADWREVVQSTEYENLSLIPAGKYEHSTPELVVPGRLKELMGVWQEEYDLVIVDSAPIGRVVDTMTMAGVVDGVLLIVGHEGASFGDVRHSLRRLSHANVIGFSLNAIDLPKRSYYYGKYGQYGRYGKHYAYYRSYYGDYYGSRYGGGKNDAEKHVHEQAVSTDT